MKMMGSCLILGFGLTLAGCGSQFDSDYQGEPLGTVKGKVLFGSGVDARDIEAAVINYNFLVHDHAIVTGAPVKGSFPADFRLDLLTPPPETAMNDFTQSGQRPDESRFSTGYLAVVRRGADVDSDPEEAIVGLASDFVLVYVDRDVKPGTESARYLGGTLSKGYHLMRYAAMSDGERAQLESECDSSAPPSEVSFPNPQVCGPTDATDKLVLNPDEFASPVTVQLLADIDEADVGNIF